jgi:hypothetical protein
MVRRRYNNNYSSNEKDRYCKVSSDVLKARLPKAIKITMQREELEDENNKNKTTTRIGRQQQEKEQDDSSRVKSLKNFV